MNSQHATRASIREDKAIEKLIALLRDKMVRESPGPNKMQRDAHPKQIGLLKAEFIIEKDLPEDLQVGVFSEEKTYSAWVRFSNQNAPPANDNVKDIRGMAIKLLDVAGRKVIDEKTDISTHDFITISTDVFVTRNVVEFAALISSLVAGKLQLIFYFLTHPKNLWNFINANKNFGSLLEARFWSVSPYSFGDRVVKYSIKPQSEFRTPVAGTSVQNYLTTIMEKQIGEKEYRFDFMVQFQKDRQRMPVEDLSVRWNEAESPFIKVATIKIPKQIFNTPEQNAFGDQLSFNPWRCLPEHTPLGGVNRARKIIYDTLSAFRHSSNGLTRVEPSPLAINKTY
jgi:catalase